MIIKRTFLLTIPLVVLAASVFAAPASMRVDYYHTGNDKEEHFSLDRIVIEPLPWPGNPARSVDNTARGKYLFEVVDAASGKLLYSRGFASVYGEWETTGEAQKINRTFSESLRFPVVDGPARVTLKKRDAKNAWQQIWTFSIDPKDKFILKGLRTPAGPLIKLHEAGDPATKLDLLILGDGYTVAERPKFERDARKLMGVLFSTSPYKERQNDINVWGLSPAAAQSGVSRPSTGIYRRSPVGVSYDAFDTERYMLTFENKTFRDLAANAPYEVVEIITNSETYGGGGIFNQFSTAAANNLWAPYLFIHEFSHHLAALADEYYTSDVAYLPPAQKVEPWEPNVTALLDPAKLKWRDLVTPGTPIPTPWPKEEFDRYVIAMQDRRRKIRADNRPEAEMDALFKEQMAHDVAMLNAPRFKGIVGAFEGANYESRGYYRPQTDCIMFTRDAVGFCAVCRRAIEDILDLYSR